LVIETIPASANCSATVSLFSGLTMALIIFMCISSPFYSFKHQGSRGSRGTVLLLP
jgi:hypothetical protein